MGWAKIRDGVRSDRVASLIWTLTKLGQDLFS
jgi:hypothetical protein